MDICSFDFDSRIDMMVSISFSVYFLFLNIIIPLNELTLHAVNRHFIYQLTNVENYSIGYNLTKNYLLFHIWEFVNKVSVYDMMS